MLENNKDLAISSQAPKELGEGSTTRLRSPERTVKAQECATLKLCKFCRVEKSLNNFYAVGNRCKACWVLKKREERALYPKRGKEATQRCRVKQQAENELLFRLKNREAQQRQREKEQLDDLVKYNAKWAHRAQLRRARKLQATPKWACLKAINEVYMKASSIGYHVDHIIPLRHPLVCGLHVENNLQILPPLENLKKSNKLLSDDIVWAPLKEGEE